MGKSEYFKVITITNYLVNNFFLIFIFPLRTVASVSTRIMFCFAECFFSLFFTLNSTARQQSLCRCHLPPHRLHPAQPQALLADPRPRAMGLRWARRVAGRGAAAAAQRRCGQWLEGGARVLAGTRDACCATEPRCSFPHDLRRRTAPCRVRSAPHLLLSPPAAAACLRALCSTTRCWGPCCRSARSHVWRCRTSDSLAASGCSCCAAAASCPPCCPASSLLSTAAGAPAQSTDTSSAPSSATSAASRTGFGPMAMKTSNLFEFY